jgi:hypothetical protein
MWISRKALLTSLLLAVAGLCAFAGLAQAATPAWKLLGVTGPTYLPPTQSEAQQVTVEAEQGTFTLSPATADGEGTLTAGLAILKVTAGSDEATLIAGEVAPAPGMDVSGAGIPTGTTVVSVEGATVTFSDASETTGFSFLTLASKEVTGVSTSLGAFHVGDGVSGKGIPTGATVAAVGAGTITLSSDPSSGGTVPLSATETTAPVAYDASAAAVQSALEGLSAATPGMFSVTGGPGGEVEHPYYVEFGGPFVDQNV